MERDEGSVPNAELPATPADAGSPPSQVPDVATESKPSNNARAKAPADAAKRPAQISPTPPARDDAPAVSSETFCTTLAESAQAHDLPVGFFSNLIWQESRFDSKSVSSKGAQGVAQFMPAVASEVGLSNPFNPFEALPAAARLLSSLFHHFGNFGLAAAAYNAGPRRVSNWLAKGGKLPGETRHYVVTITGRPADEWRGTNPKPVLFKLPPRMPCRHIDVFAQADQAAHEQEAREQAQRDAAERNRKAAESAAMQRSLVIAKKGGQQPPKRASVKVAMSGLRHARDSRRQQQAQAASAGANAKPAAHKSAAANRSASKPRHGKIADAG